MVTFEVIEQEARARALMLLEKMSAEYTDTAGDNVDRIVSRLDVETAISLGFAHVAALAVPFMRMLESRTAQRRADQLEQLQPHMSDGEFELVSEEKMRLAIEENWRATPQP